MIVAANHLSYADVLALALFCDQAGRYPTFLAKSSLFKIPVLGPIIVKLGQLPVYRGQADAGLVLRDAEQGVKDGACVIFYPEGTVTRDPALWPMHSKTGVARLALATGAPVVPVAHWGAQDVLAYGSFRPHVIPRRTVHIIAGPPVDLSEFAGLPLDTPTLRAATDKIMTEVSALARQAARRGPTRPSPTIRRSPAASSVPSCASSPSRPRATLRPRCQSGHGPTPRPARTRGQPQAPADGQPDATPGTRPARFTGP